MSGAVGETEHTLRHEVTRHAAAAIEELAAFAVNASIEHHGGDIQDIGAFSLGLVRIGNIWAAGIDARFDGQHGEKGQSAFARRASTTASASLKPTTGSRKQTKEYVVVASRHENERESEWGLIVSINRRSRSKQRIDMPGDQLLHGTHFSMTRKSPYETEVNLGVSCDKRPQLASQPRQNDRFIGAIAGGLVAAEISGATGYDASSGTGTFIEALRVLNQVFDSWILNAVEETASSVTL